ncbi:phospholipase DDHD2 isoform X2 [Chelonus insularis]|uniref:phospholipase DDHD2 isoform X2 n=1 Tax=Chelonus insularis TaxID=460826 RepID=UPI00158BB1EA|nr:phospholipase DDHD2 isoform X2 [Chelonus insularis]
MSEQHVKSSSTSSPEVGNTLAGFGVSPVIPDPAQLPQISTTDNQFTNNNLFGNDNKLIENVTHSEGPKVTSSAPPLLSSPNISASTPTYRLGHQRRLKYAPSPYLTTTTPPSSASSFLPPPTADNYSSAPGIVNAPDILKISNDPPPKPTFTPPRADFIDQKHVIGAPPVVPVTSAVPSSASNLGLPPSITSPLRAPPLTTATFGAPPLTSATPAIPPPLGTPPITTFNQQNLVLNSNSTPSTNLNRSSPIQQQSTLSNYFSSSTSSDNGNNFFQPNFPNLNQENLNRNDNSITDFSALTPDTKIAESTPTVLNTPCSEIKIKPLIKNNFNINRNESITGLADKIDTQLNFNNNSNDKQTSIASYVTTEPINANQQNFPPLLYNPVNLANKYEPNLELTVSNTTFESISTLQNNFMTRVMPEPTLPATINPSQDFMNPFSNQRLHTDRIIPQSFENLSNKIMTYRPVYYHWFYCRKIENKLLWYPFSMHDSLNLEEVHNSNTITPETVVATDGGRYDVEIIKRQRSPVYWSGISTEVRRSSWFYKGSSESRYVPYEESIAARLEEEYKQACLSNDWNRQVQLGNGEYIVFHSPTIQVHYLPTSTENSPSWSKTYVTPNRPKVVKRGVDEFNIDEGEPEKIDHLLFLVHGIGSVCDLKFRTVEEVVDEFRSISYQLVQSHYRTASTHGIVNRIEVLPISWHATLHSEDTGIDKKLRAITLESIPKLRHFTNDTLLDVLFYTSPIYCQTIMQTVGNEMNRLYALFKDRNPTFGGNVYLGGHSLGSLIMFDLLCHQKPVPEKTREDVTETADLDEHENSEDDVFNSTLPKMPYRPPLKRRESRRISYVMGGAGTGQPFIIYPQLNFHPKAFFALGSPIGMFVTVRGIDNLGENFKLPTCPAFFNIFHPFDPVAYRVEPLVNPEAHKYSPMLIPHHKGRKRMHLELKETMARVGADLKEKIMNSVKNTWNSVYQLAMFYQSDNRALEQEIDKVVEEQLQKSSLMSDQASHSSGMQHSSDKTNNYDDDNEDRENSSINNHHHQSDSSDNGCKMDFNVGNLNGGRRIDYVLQETPFEYINEYIFALTSHVCYWESEDTMLLILKEMYNSSGIQADAQLPQQMLTSNQVSYLSSNSLSSSSLSPGPMSPQQTIDPTAPPMNPEFIGPPPKSGFVQRS